MSSIRQLFFEHIGQTSDFPMGLEISKAKGNYLFDNNNKKYLDLISGIAVSNIGHGNPAVIDAVKAQAECNMHVMVYGEYILSPQVQLANELCKYLPDTLNSVFFVNSGSEATEGAMKLVKRFTGRTKIISFHNSYHGATQGALSLGGNEEMRNSFRPLLPDMTRVSFNDFEALNEIDEQTAAVFIEPVQAEAGVIFPENNFLKCIREKCNTTGALLVFDEIQIAFGRLGSLFAFEKFNVVPDVLLLGKALGGGMPLGAFVTSTNIMQCLRTNPVLGHITTFGGHPVSCAAAKASLVYIQENKLIEEVKNKSNLIKEILDSNKVFTNYRGNGLFWAIQLPNFEKVQKTIAKCLEKGIIIDWFLYNNSAIRIAPPLTILNEELEFALNTIATIISE